MRLAKAIPLFLFTLAMLMPAAGARAGELSPGLQRLLDDTQADEPVSVIVHFEEKADIVGLSDRLNAESATLARRHSEVIYALKAAARTQEDLARELDSAVASDRGVLGYTRYWISNMMVVQALPVEIERIAYREDVSWVEPNFAAELIKPNNKYPAPSGTEMDTRGIGMAPGIGVVRAPEVWNQLGIDGTGALIGSMDTGVDGTHPAFASRYRGLHAPAEECWLDVLGNGTTFPVDNHGHGTHTVGTMAGLAPDDTIGVAPGAEWIAANPIDQGVNPDFDNDIFNCFQFFTDPDGNPDTMADVPDVVQNSWGVHEGFTGYYDCDDRWWDLIDNCEAAGVVVVWSAGNEGPGAGTLRSPGDRATSIYNAFSVGSTIHSEPYTVSSFSSRGPTTCDVLDEDFLIKPEISAPGSDIYSAAPGGGYQYMSGTSMAGPHVSGVVALMRAANPDLPVNTIKQIIMETARDLGTPGEDNDYGWGMIDAYACVEAAMSGYGTLAGNVTNASFGGVPLGGARIEIPARDLAVTTNEIGEYRVGLPAGQYRIVVSYPGFANGTIENIVIVENEETIQNVALTDIAGPVMSDPVGELATSDYLGPYDLGITAFDPSTVTDVTLVYEMHPGGSGEVPMAMEGDAYVAQLPGQTANTRIDYRYRAEDGLGQVSWYPTDGSFLTLYVTEEFYMTDAEDPGDPDWRTGVTGDTATAGVWVRADPVGTAYENVPIQPEDDHTEDPGVACFVTGNGSVGGASGEQDVDDGCTTLMSPVFDLEAGGAEVAVVQYWVWYGVGGWTVNDDFVTEVSHDGGTTWTEIHRIVGQANSWQRVSVVLNELPEPFALTDQVVFRFLACDLGDGGLVEAAIDDFVIETYRAPTVSGTQDVPGAGPAVVLRQNHPNPFNPSTTIAFNLAREAEVELSVYALDGRRVATLLQDSTSAGEHFVTWAGTDQSGRAVASGAYFYRLVVDGQQQVKRMVLVK